MQRLWKLKHVQFSVLGTDYTIIPLSFELFLRGTCIDAQIQAYNLIQNKVLLFILNVGQLFIYSYIAYGRYIIYIKL